MEGWLIFAAVAVVLGAIAIYVVFMVFLPEWVGITGKKALEAERSHVENSVATESDLITKLQEKKKN